MAHEAFQNGEWDKAAEVRGFGAAEMAFVNAMLDEPSKESAQLTTTEPHELDRPTAGRPVQLMRFSRRELRRLFGRFIEHRIHKRHLRRAETPHFCRFVPLSVLERLMGHVLVLKAFKPLSSAIGTPLAA